MCVSIMRLCVISSAIVFLVVISSAKSNNICPEERRFKINVTEFFPRNTTVRHYQWCMNVPPRCSFYTTRITNESRTVEKEVTELVQNCCPGYAKDPTRNECVANCPGCQNGTCIHGKCVCHPGFQGTSCDAPCESARWGKNCRFNCTCVRGECDRRTGSCDCPAGWTGTRCQIGCPRGFFGKNCRHDCTCEKYESCDPVNGKCEITESTTMTPRFSEEPSSSSPIGTTTTPSITISEEAISSTATSSSTTTRHVENTESETEETSTTPRSASTSTTPRIVVISTLPITHRPSSSDFTDDVEDISSTTAKQIDPVRKNASDLVIVFNNNGRFDPTKIQIQRSDENRRANSKRNNPKPKVPMSVESNFLLSSSSDDDADEDDNNQASMDNISIEPAGVEENVNNGNSGSYYNNNLLISGAIVLIALIFIVPATVVLLLLIRTSHRKRLNDTTANSSARFENGRKDDGKKSFNKKKSSAASVSVYTRHSIFHTPLPDPPIFENPVFASPITINDTTAPSTYDYPTQGRIETRFTYSMNFPTATITRSTTKLSADNKRISGGDFGKEFLYDHPPSTGSYRAASIPEPEVFERHGGHGGEDDGSVVHYEEEEDDFKPKVVPVEGSLIVEPLYDEIPVNRYPPPYQESSDNNKSELLYMNTRL